MKTEIEIKVRSMIANQIEKSPESINLEEDLQEDLGLDDLEMTLLMLAVGEEFGFSVLIEDERYLKTGQDIVEYVQQKLQGKMGGGR